MEQASLYERLGGTPALKKAVVRLYGRIMTDPLLSPFFDPDEIERLRRSQMSFLIMAFGGSHHYTGKNLREAHAPLVAEGLSDRHFDAVRGHLGETLSEMGVAPDLIAEALAIVESTRRDVLNL